MNATWDGHVLRRVSTGLALGTVGLGFCPRGTGTPWQWVLIGWRCGWEATEEEAKAKVEATAAELGWEARR